MSHEMYLKLTVFQQISENTFDQISILWMRFTDTNQIKEIKLLEYIQSKFCWKIH